MASITTARFDFLAVIPADYPPSNNFIVGFDVADNKLKKMDSFGAVTVIGEDSAAIIANTVFVSKNGDDSTGLVQRLDKPFLTIVAAQNVAVSGDIIIIFPGTYSESGLGKNGINYHFMNGAIVSAGTSNMWIDTGSISYSITGDGEFNATTGRIALMTNTGTIIMTGKKMSGNVWAQSSAKLYINMRYITHTSGGLFSLNHTAALYVECPSISSTGQIATVSSTSSASLYINSVIITSSTSGFMFSMGGVVNIYGKIIHTGTGSTFAIGSGSTNVNHNFYGDIEANSITGWFFLCAGTSGAVNFYGKISASAYINITQGNIVLSLYNEVITNANSASIIPASGTLKVMSKLENLDANITSVAISLSSSSATCILNNATLVTGAGGAPSIDAATAKNVLVYGACQANTNVGVNITQQVGTITVNSLVI